MFWVAQEKLKLVDSYQLIVDNLKKRKQSFYL